MLYGELLTTILYFVILWHTTEIGNLDAEMSGSSYHVSMPFRDLKFNVLYHDPAIPAVICNLMSMCHDSATYCRDERFDHNGAELGWNWVLTSGMWWIMWEIRNLKWMRRVGIKLNIHIKVVMDDFNLDMNIQDVMNNWEKIGRNWTMTSCIS